MEDWYRREIEAVVSRLQTDAVNGLGDPEATVRLEKHGPNELRGRGGKHPLRILLEQFSSTMVLILIAAAVISAFLGELTETIAIAAIVILFALLGFFQEYRAERAMAALRKMAVPSVRVRRNGRIREISARELVPGDIVLVEAGNVIPADLRVLESVNLRTQEASLTGESEPVGKTVAAIDAPDLSPGDRRNMAFMGTVVTYGRGAGVVTGTGMETELGRIADLITQEGETLTPLQRRLNTVGKGLALLGILVAGLVMGIGLLRGESLEDMLLTAVSVAVAVIPEGMPAVVTITLALGAQRMLRRKALIRKLPAVETLGSVTVICTDKTGTLTENRMTVTIIDVAGHYLELMGTREHPAPVLRKPGGPEELAGHLPAVRLILAAGALCNDAELIAESETGGPAAVGDPTEGALLVAAAQAGIEKSDLEKLLPRTAEVPFDSDRKRMTTVHSIDQGSERLAALLKPLRDMGTPWVAITKGAVDGLMEITGSIWVEDRPEPFGPEWRDRIRDANAQMAKNGMRVLGLAIRPIETLPPKSTPEEYERDQIFIGLIGMVDPPRPEVRVAVGRCKTAGIRPVMITGDHPLTARFIAYDLRISENGQVRTGQDLVRISLDELGRQADTCSVYARVSPEHKLRIVEAYQKEGHIVAMTGDGVNDAPALRRADIGIAMGITGTDVAKEASDMVLLDDNFATIVSAVEEGRAIYANIRRFVKFSIAGNIGKIIVMLFAPLAGITVALLPLQLLWLNLLTDGLLGLGLGLEAAEPDTMQKPPRDPRAGFFSRGMSIHLAWVGALIGAVSLGTGIAFFDPAVPEDRTWQTMIFATIAFLQIGQALAARSTTVSFFSLGIRRNPVIFLMVFLVILLQLGVIYLPGPAAIFGIVPLSPVNLILCAVMGSLAFIAIEVVKASRRSASPGKHE